MWALCKIAIWAPVTPHDHRLISDPVTIVEGLKLKNLHELYEYTLLPVESRIIYKLMLLTYKALNNQAPKYLCELISIKKPSCSLRSNTSIVLHRKKSNTVTYGQRSFHHAAPELWNQLPSHVKNGTSLQQFKSLLKAHLFSKWLFLFVFVFLYVFFFCKAHCGPVTECA